MSAVNISDQHLSTMATFGDDLCDGMDIITVEKSLYDTLSKAANEYAALTKALIHAGVSQDHLDTLIGSVTVANTDFEPPSSSHRVRAPSTLLSKSPLRAQWSADAPVFVPKKQHASSRQNLGTIKPFHSIPPTPPSLRSEDPESSPDLNDASDGSSEQEDFDNDHQDRSIILRGFPPFTTLADVAKVVRGGIILNMYIREREREAHVSFVDPLAAEKFVMHYKRNDLYTKGKRIDVCWDDKQYYMAGYLRRQVYNNGATRNLVVRFAPQGMTAETVRQDLEHIHRLEIVDIVTTDNHIFVSTNSIQHAVTAKYCMQSQLKYKSTRIEFFEDECDQVPPAFVKKMPKQGFEPQKRPATVAMANRFALLFDEDDDLEHKETSTKRTVSVGEAKEPA